MSEENNETELADDNKEISENKRDEETEGGITLTGRIGPSPGSSCQFKRPLLLVGPRKGAHKFTKLKIPALESEVKIDDADNSNNEEVKADKTEEVKQPDILHKSPAEIMKEKNVPVPYKEPKWSGLPSQSYSFEVLKSGTIVDNINLNNKPFFVFGRLANCDIIMAHPTISRFHAVLQYRIEGDEEHPPGFYVYDLGSTHGTFLNKYKLKPNIFVRVQVGHMLRLGMSTRNYLLQGPTDDEEPESELSVTELKALRLKEKLAAELAEKQRIAVEEMEEEISRKKEEEAGVDWGMGEDADEETDLTENPFAVTQNEDLYINDPKKTLRGWFEREGYDLEYNCEEKGFGQFVCRVELPIDNARGLPITAEAVVRGKKKESVVQCALEACRILDQHGLLRQSNHESKKRKAKNWEDDDYYDSDDDTFLDRTGTVEKKRKSRMEQAGLKNNTEVHTYQSLIERHKKIIEDIQTLELELRDSTTKQADSEKKSKDDNEDELDAYMSSLSSTEKRDKKNVSKIKNQLSALRQEEVTVRNLANIAKPAELPELKPTASQLPSPVNKQKLPIIGKRKVGAKKPIQVFQSQQAEQSMRSDGLVEEVDSD